MLKCGVKVNRITGKARVVLGDGKCCIVTGFTDDFKSIHFGRDEECKFGNDEAVKGETENSMGLKSSIVFTTEESLDNIIEVLQSLKTIKE